MAGSAVVAPRAEEEKKASGGRAWLSVWNDEDPPETESPGEAPSLGTRLRQDDIGRALGRTQNGSAAFDRAGAAASEAGRPPESAGARALTAFRGRVLEAPPDLTMAAMTGYGDSFRRQGLKLSPDRSRILRGDGTPATEEDLSRLRRDILAEPEALKRYPNLFGVISRARYEKLKDDIKDPAGKHAAAFRDIGLTPDERDFKWSRDCRKITGKCNPHTVSVRYRNGEFVPPKDLKAVSLAVTKDEPKPKAAARRPRNSPAAGEPERRGDLKGDARYLWSEVLKSPEGALLALFEGGKAGLAAARNRSAVDWFKKWPIWLIMLPPGLLIVALGFWGKGD